MQTFETAIDTRDVDVNYFKEIVLCSPDIDLEFNCETKVFWTFDVECREWGVKSLSAYADRVICVIEYSCDDEFLSEAERAVLKIAGCIEMNSGTWEGKYEIDTQLCKDWTLKNDIEIINSSVRPDAVEIDFKTKTLTVT